MLDKKYIWDDGIYRPQLISKTIQRDGRNYITTYDQYDDHGNPKRIVESSGINNRETLLTYWKDETRNIVRDHPQTKAILGSFEKVFVTEYEYFPSGYLKEVERNKSSGKSGIKTSYDYYKKMSNLLSLGYTETGEMLRVTDPNSYRKTYEWAHGRLKSIDNDIYTVEYVTNGDGTVRSVNNGRNRQSSTVYDYDDNLYLTLIDPPAGNSTLITYPSDGSYSSRTERVGSYSKTSSYDGFGRLIGTSDSRGVTATISYTAYGSKLFSDSNVGDRIYYDLFGRIDRIVHKDEKQINYTYTLNKVLISDEAQKTRVLTYASFGNPDEKLLTHVKEPGITTLTTYNYNILGSLLTITQGTNVRAYTYDSRNYLLSEESPETGRIDYLRQPNGLLKTKTDSKGMIEYRYDSAARLDWMRSGAITLDFAYDSTDNLVVMNSPAAKVSFVYDAVNRQTEKKETILGKDYKTIYRYDGNGNIDSVTYPTGLFVDHVISQSKNQISDIVGYVSGIQYNLAGQPTSYLYANGVLNTFSYNSRHFNTGIAASELMSWEYVSDSRGNTVEINYLMDSPISRNQSFTYDDVGRLEDFNGPWNWGEYSYYDNGNRKSKTVHGHKNTYYYDSSTNRLMSIEGPEVSSYTYNGDGSVDRGTWIDDIYQFSYDEFKNLAAVTKNGITVSQYGYDADGMRVFKCMGDPITETTVYHYDQNGNVISETTPNGGRIADYVYLNNKLIAKVSSPRDSDGDGIMDDVDIDDDNDGMPDAYEYTYSFLSAYDATDAATDFDGDGLTNIQEYQFGTNPELVDSDSDGASDLAEWVAIYIMPIINNYILN